MQIVRAILPKTDALINKSLLDAEIKKALTDTSIDARNSLSAPTKNWHDKPTFVLQYRFLGNSRWARIYPSRDRKASLKYIWIDKGVGGHFIRPRRRKYLRFMKGYQAATIPRSLIGRAARRFPPTVYSKGHWWPGITARYFSETAAALVTPIFFSRIQRALKNAVRASR